LKAHTLILGHLRPFGNWFSLATAYAEQTARRRVTRIYLKRSSRSPDCRHPRRRVVNLPQTHLKDRLVQVRGSAPTPRHTICRCRWFRRSGQGPVSLFQYYLLDTGRLSSPTSSTKLFSRNPTTTVQLTATGGRLAGLATPRDRPIGARAKAGAAHRSRVNPKALLSMSLRTISPLFVINNESGWYEGLDDSRSSWVPDTAGPRRGRERAHGSVRGKITAAGCRRVARNGQSPQCRRGALHDRWTPRFHFPSKSGSLPRTK